MNQPNNIAIWNPAYLGDAILTLPIVKVLHEAFPKSSLDLYVRHGFGSLFASQNELRNVFDPPRLRSPQNLLKQIKTIRMCKYDMWISVHTSPRSSLIALASGAKIRIGFNGGIRNLAYTHTVNRNFGMQDEIERVLNLSKPIFELFPYAIPSGFDAEDANNPWHWPKLNLDAEALFSAHKFVASLHGSGPLLGINPCSVWRTKRWLPENFAQIAKLAVNAGARVIILASESERTDVDEVFSYGLSDDDRIINACGKFNLPTLAALISLLDGYLTNDSGPMHIAWSFNVPVTAIFGPTVKNFGFAPRGENSTLIESACHLPCRPCGLHGSNDCPKQHFRCMREISPEQVWEDVKKKIFNETKGEK